MPATIRYNTFRLALLIIVGAVCYIAGARQLVLIVLMFAISLPLSYVLLSRWRHAMIEEIASRDLHKFNVVKSISDRIDAANDAEDAKIDLAESNRANAERDDA